MTQLPIEVIMKSHYKINSEDLGEYLAVLARYAEVPQDDDEKMRELMRSYAELKFKIMGGSRCAMCKSHVRHVVPVVVETPSGEVNRYSCLCTRCFEGEKGQAERMFLEVGDNRVEVKIHKREHVRSATAYALGIPKSQA